MIPAVAHFIWFGARLPWAHGLALRTAASHGGFERVVLHCADDLSRTPVWPELLAIPGFEARRLDAPAIAGLFAAIDRGDELRAIYQTLDAPAARANVLRAVILALEGGVYLDLDTLTVRPLDPLRRRYGAFCGEERLVWPAAVRRSSSLVTQLGGLARAGARDLCRRLPGGWAYFRALEPWYPSAANNAVLGAAPGHPFVRRLLDGMLAVPASRRKVRFALGTHLLQDTLASGREADLGVLPPPVFYPLGPEISEHWFRIHRPLRGAALRRELPAIDEVIAAETLVVHWYASVRTKAIVPQIDADYLRAHADRQLFSALALALTQERR